MPGSTTLQREAATSRLDRALGVFTDVRANEGVTAVLMLVNVFLLLVCYSVIKTVREPLILLGGGAEVRSYAAAGQALVLMGFVPLYGWVASRVDRVKLIVGVTLFFVACIELFSFAVSVRMPYVGVAFFIWVGTFNISLVAQFWSFANDLYRKEAGERLFPMIMVGMTAGAPLGSFIAARLFRSGLTPELILQVSALLLTTSVGLYLLINRREARDASAPTQPLASAGGFALVLGNRYLRLVAALVVLLNIVNTTGEYVVAKMLTSHVAELASITPNFNKQAFIGGFSGDYQFWVNVTALLLQAFVTSRLVKFKGLQGALLALPLIALGGYSLIAAGVGFTVVRWVKTAENATDYSVMNTARQLLWLPTTREEKYKAKQAIDTFCVRAGDVLSAGVVYFGTQKLHLAPSQFALVNVALTLAWIGIARLVLRPAQTRTRIAMPRLAGASAAAAAVMLVALTSPASAQETRAEVLAAERQQKAVNLQPYTLNPLERRIDFVARAIANKRAVYPFIGSVFEGGGIAIGPGYRQSFGDSGLVTAHAAVSLRSYAGIDAELALPEFGNGRLRVAFHGEGTHAPTVAFFGIGTNSTRDSRNTFKYDTASVGTTARLQTSSMFALGGGFDYLRTNARGDAQGNAAFAASLAPSYARSSIFAERDSRTAPGYTSTGGLLRADFSDYRQTNGTESGFQRVDAEAQRFIPLLHESRVIALRAAASTTFTDGGQDVPYFLMPDLGGHQALRGYSSFRFRDRSSLLLTGEYRWSAGPLVDMALFADAGTVAPRLNAVSLRDLHTSYGIGFTVHTPSTTFTRIELARSREGLGLLVSFGPSF